MAKNHSFNFLYSLISFFSSLLACFLSFSSISFASALPLSTYVEKPKLVLVLVIDQFRADYLTRFESRFLASEKNGKVGGFKYLMEKSAYFPFAEYDILQSMTCPGHATILTGSHPSSMGIPLNEWFDQKTKSKRYCVQDDIDGVSPRSLLTTTVGDELKNAGYKSKIITISLKDRTAIMLGGHRGDLALWLDPKKSAWTSSSYYLTNGELPIWVKNKNKELQNSLEQDYQWTFLGAPSGLSEQIWTLPIKVSKKNISLLFSYPWAVEESINLGIEALKSLQLSPLSKATSESSTKVKKAPTHILAISLSTHDMLGHRFGPNSPEMEELTLAEDRAISKILNEVKKELGGSLKDLLVVLTADHGIPSTIEYNKAAKISAGKLDYQHLQQIAYDFLNKKYSKPSAQEWFADTKSLNFYLNSDILLEKKLSAEVVSQDLKTLFKKEEGVFDVITKKEILENKIQNPVLADQAKNTYVDGINGDFIIIPKPFWMEKDDNLVTHHMTGYSYDRSVPILLMGAKFKKGVYPSKAKVIDIAPTLSFSLGILPPAMCEGRVLHEIF